MSAPPHSVEPMPGGLGQDRYAERDSFLHLLLGLISTSERILQIAPGLASQNPSPGTDRARAARKNDANGVILR